ncbi:hypothetical protein GGI04_005611, partial [Coemansia thaxteri]
MASTYLAITTGSVELSVYAQPEVACEIQILASSFVSGSVEALSTIEHHAALIQHCVEHGGPNAVLAVFDSF